MAEKSSAHEKLNGLIKLSKEQIKRSQAIADYISAVSADLNERLIKLDKKLDDLNSEVNKIDKIVKEQHVYTDEEIYQMKATMSWRRVHERTNIPLSTLQYRYRKYKSHIEEQEEIII